MEGTYGRTKGRDVGKRRGGEGGLTRCFGGGELSEACP